MSNDGVADRTYKDFAEALRELMVARGFSFPKLAREIGRRFSIAYVHNLASGKSKPTKENIEIIAAGLKVEPSYFKEYREYKAKEKIDSSPEIADFLLDEQSAEITSELGALTKEQKSELVQLIKEFRARYQTHPKDNT